jgi:glutamate 5-kinase
MSASRKARSGLGRARRFVVKIGSRTIANDGMTQARLAADIAALRKDKRSIVVVSSGAIALGCKKLGYRSRPKEMAKLQAAAAAGQSLLMRAYETAFEALKIPVAQVLLTHADLADRTRSNNARAALAALLDAGAIPILNENDSVAVDEIRFGDNDQLASMVAPLVDADALVLLSDVDGVLDSHGNRIREVSDVAREVLPHVRAETSDVGTGGMGSKVEAARRATWIGAHAVIANARQEDVLSTLVGGGDVGTVFLPQGNPLSAKKWWIAFTLRPRGDIVLDRGAALAVVGKNTSVLAVGVLGVRGDFRRGDAVRLLSGDGTELARGLSRLSSAETAQVAGRPRAYFEERGDDPILVHKDELVPAACFSP